MSDQIKLHGRVFITGHIKTETGLHIGGSEGEISIGGVDNTVVRDPLTQRPYIPGSSLKGKMRSLIEKSLGAKQNREVGQAVIHLCEKESEYKECVVCHIYGTTGEKEFGGPTRLIVRDVQLLEKSLEKAKTDLPFTEVKWEVAIDRVTSAAVPRQLERVPAGAAFGPFELVYSLYDADDVTRFKNLIDGMSLLEDDYLGGSGSRGSGKISFVNLEVTLKTSDDYLTPQPLGNYDNLGQLADGLTTIQSDLKAIIPAS